MSAAVPFVAAEDLKVHFRTVHGRAKVRAVDGVTFAVLRGETFGIIGESGSGKSTLGRALVGLQKPTGGKIVHQGRDLFSLRRRELAVHRRDFPIVFQGRKSCMAIFRDITESKKINQMARLWAYL